MSNEDPQSVVLQFYHAFDQRQMDRAISFLAPDFVAHLPGQSEPLNRDQFHQFGMGFYLAFSQGQHQFDQVVVEANKVVTCGTFTALHSGNFQGLPPTGKSIRLAIMHLDRVENDQIVEHWGHGDALGLMQQLGIIFLPGPNLLPSLIKNSVSKWLQRQ